MTALVGKVIANMSKIKAVCVYCGSSPGHDLAYVEAGERLGRALAAMA
ncbi:putative Rossmann-fold nucleotide-binding protein [Bradyrhizobium elkanii]